MTDNCCSCIHDNVCKVKERFYEIQGMCEEADEKYDDIYIHFHCKYFSEKQTIRKLEWADMPTTP